MIGTGTIVLGTVLSVNFTLCFAILSRTVAKIGAEESKTIVIKTDSKNEEKE